MTTGKEWKLILLFTLPIMAGNLLQQLYNVVDGIIVGNFVSESAFAAVTACQPLTMLYLALAIGISVGVGIVVSQYFGAGKKDELPVAVNTALILLGACGLIITMIGVIYSPFMLKHVLRIPDDIRADSVTYMRIYSAGLLFQFLYNGIAATLRGFGDSKATLYFLLISAILSAALTFVFVLVIEWGVAGAAFSTVIAQAVCAAVSYMYLRKRFPYSKNVKRWDRGIAATMTRLGLPIAVQLGFVSFGTGAMQRLVNGFASTVPGIIAAYGAVMRLDFIIYIPMMGFQTGLATFTGQNIGAGNLDRVKRGFHATLAMTMLITVILSTAFYIYAESVVGVFGLTDDALKIGISLIKFLMLFYWLFCAYMAVGGVLQGAGDTVLLSVTTLSALATRVLTGYLAVYFGILGYTAAWVTAPIAWLVAIAISYSRYFSGAWKKKAVAGRFKQGS